MALTGPGPKEVKELHNSNDVVGMVKMYGATKRRDTSETIIKGLNHLGEPARLTVLDILGGEELQRTAGAVLTEMGTESFDDVKAMLDDEDAVRRAGALYTVYYYARYRDLPEALALLKETAAREEPADLAQAAAGMVERVELLRKERDTQIEELLTKTALLVQEESTQPDNVLMKMYSSKRRQRVDTMMQIVNLRYTAVRPIIDRAGEYGDTAVAALLGLALNQIGPGAIAPIVQALPDADKRKRSVLMRALLCMQHAGIPGAREAVEDSGINVTTGLDRAAARVYKMWVK